MKHTTLASWLLLISLQSFAQGNQARIERIGTVKHTPLGEMSGIVRSERYPGVWWVHNDSGAGPRLFALDSAGKVLVPTRSRKRFHGEKAITGSRPWPGVEIAGARNVDWEDLALDKGTIYLADLGNNNNARRNLGIYVFKEPDPHRADRTRNLSFLPVHFPEQKAFPAKKWHFDCESIFIDRGRIYLLTKHRNTNADHSLVTGTNLYRLDTRHTDRPNPLKLIDSHPDLLPTAADLSPDGRRLAVLSLMAVHIFERPEKGDRWLTGRVSRHPLPVFLTQQAEGLCWDDSQTLRITNEQRGIFLLHLPSQSR
jgi:hypothetical protein